MNSPNNLPTTTVLSYNKEYSRWVWAPWRGHQLSKVIASCIRLIYYLSAMFLTVGKTVHRSDYNGIHEYASWASA